MDSERTKTIVSSTTLCQIWPTQAVEQVSQMLGTINEANSIMRNVSATAQTSAIKGGFAAETWHAESFNLDAILKGKDARAFTDNFANTPLPRNHKIHDIVIMKGDEQKLGAQLKYFKDADKTQKAFRSSKDGIHRYQDSDLFLGPSDQIDDIKLSANQTALKEQQNRPAVSQAAEKVRDKTAGQLDMDGAQSSPLSKREAEQVGTGSKPGTDLREGMHKSYLDKSTIQQSVRAAGSAALITTVIAGTINTFQHVEQVRNGEITVEQATLRILQNTVIAAGDSALKAGIATGSVSIAARELPGLFAGSAFSSSLATGGIAGAAICVVDLVQCIVLFAAGQMTLDELETRTGKNVLQTGAGFIGTAVGAAVGAAGGPVGALIGGFVGGMITSLAMSIAVDNHIEKTFRLTLASTEQIVSNGLVMHDTLQYLQVSQQYYADFQIGLYLSERHFAAQGKILLAQSARLKDKVDNL